MEAKKGVWEVCSPVDDVLALQIVQRQGHLTEVELDSLFTELNALLQVIAQVSSQQEVHHHEHVLLVLEGVPENSSRRTRFVSVLVECIKKKNYKKKQGQRLSTHTQHRSEGDAVMLLHAADAAQKTFANTCTFTETNRRLTAAEDNVCVRTLGNAAFMCHPSTAQQHNS